MNPYGAQPTQDYQPYTSSQMQDPREFQQQQGFPEDRMPAPQQPCEKTEEKKGFFDKFKFWGGKRSKRTKRKRSKRRKSRRS
jgi:hypothetical protein